MKFKQSSFGWFNNQKIVNNNIVVDEKYLQHLLTFQNNPSDVNQIVLSLYNAISEDTTTNEKRNLPPEIEDKISFNNVVAYKLLIETNFSENGFYLDAAYEALDSDTPGRKKLFLSFINNLYLSILGNLIQKNPKSSKIETIKTSADSILAEVINKLLLRISNNTKGIEHISGENIESIVIAIACNAFVDCKVLENPNSQ